MKKILVHFPQLKQNEVHLTGILPRQTDQQKELFQPLDYTCISARYDHIYKITKEQFVQLVPCVPNAMT
jgi:hypothetical protein